MRRANVFDGILPASSSFGGTKGVSYDVFINHRGPDTKKMLATPIYDALTRMGVRTFLDEQELKLGDSIPHDIDEAMATSSLHIAIFSPTYADSAWCLAELAFMVKSGKKIIPLFYDVDPSDLRWIGKEKGAYAESFFKHKSRYAAEIVEDWKRALEIVSNLKGHIVENEDYKEALKSIEDNILDQREKIPFVVPKYSVGLKKTLQDFETVVFESFENAKIVGITGMAGCGKTTLAKGYYNKMMGSFYRCSFISDIRNTSIHENQKKLFQDFGGSKNISFDNVEEGKAILAKYLKTVKVFIVLDNVDKKNQVDALLPIKDILVQGSVIVITSRDPSLLTSCEISSNFIYEMKNLCDEDAMKLFCLHAFQSHSPIDEFEGLVKSFLKICKGLPLALEVLGALVHGKSKEYWTVQLQKFSGSLHCDISKILRVSFDVLEKEEQEIFLDISCFFVGTAKSWAIAVWEPLEYSGAGSLENLIVKCLIKVDRGNCLEMHDLLRDLGREISKTRSPYRLWSPQQIAHIQDQGMESISIRGIIARTDEFYEEFVELVAPSSGRGIKWMGGIKIMDVENNYFTEELVRLSGSPVSPVYLRWDKFPHGALPSWISWKKMRVLNILNASKLEELWSETNLPVQLRVLNIVQAQNFQRFPESIGFLKLLKEISLHHSGVSKISFSPDSCPLLDLLRLNCNHELVQIDSLPKSVKRVIVSECSNLQVISVNCGRAIMGLKYLCFDRCGKLKEIQGLQNGHNLTNLQDLEVLSCSCLTFPTETLALLDVPEGNSCAEPTEPIFTAECSFFKLRRVHLFDSCGVSRISISPHACPNLDSLYIEQMYDLVKIDSLPISVRTVRALRCPNLQSLNCGVNVMRLQHLRIEGCEKFEEIQGLENCRSLQFLRLESLGPNLPIIWRALNDMEHLFELNLSATCHIGAFEACLKSLDRQKWPSLLTLCARDVVGVEAILKTSTFPALTLVHSFAHHEKENYYPYRAYEFMQECSDEAALICLVANCKASYHNVMFPTSSHFTTLKKGKWVMIAVINRLSLPEEVVAVIDAEMGILVTGDGVSVINAFYELVQHLGKGGNICEAQS